MPKIGRDGPQLGDAGSKMRRLVEGCFMGPSLSGVDISAQLGEGI